MATLDLRWFASEGTLREINPRHLLRLLSPHATFLAIRGVVLPDERSGVLPDYAALRHVLLNLDQTTPPALIDSLYYVKELATPDCMDALLDAAEARGVRLESDAESTPIDVAIEVWLHDPALLQEKHAEGLLLKPRSYAFFKSRAAGLDFQTPDSACLQRCEASLDEWFQKHRRGTGARIFCYPKGERVCFLVRHGHTFRRETSSNNGEPGSVAFRPLKFDVVVYYPEAGEIGMNAETEGEKDLYRRKFGLHLFGAEDHFPATDKYTLKPLRESGRDALEAGNEAIEWIKLKEVRFLRRGAQGEIETHKAKDVFAAFDERKANFPAHPIIGARFELKFAGSKTPRTVAIYPPNRAQYTRDHDSEHIDAWLRDREFIVARTTSAERLVNVALARS